MLCREQHQSVASTTLVLGDGMDELCDMVDGADFLSDEGVEYNYEMENASTIRSIEIVAPEKSFAFFLNTFRVIMSNFDNS